MNYPADFPVPLRAEFGEDLDFRTTQVQMEQGFTVQRRKDMYVYRQLSLAYQMGMDHWFAWYAWMDRFGFDWFTADIQGESVTMRLISPIDYDYLDFATVAVTVRSEVRMLDAPEEWTGTAPVQYAPPVNATDGAVNGAVTPDIDLNTNPGVLSVLLDVVPKAQIIRAPAQVHAIGVIYAYGDVTLELYDETGTTLLATSNDHVLRWHHDPAVTNDMLRLTAGEDFQLRILGEQDSTVDIWGAAQWR